MLYEIVFESSVFIRLPENDKSAFKTLPLETVVENLHFHCPKMLGDYFRVKIR